MLSKKCPLSCLIAALAIAIALLQFGAAHCYAQGDLEAQLDEDAAEQTSKREAPVLGIAAQAIPFLAVGFTPEEGAESSKLISIDEIKLLMRVSSNAEDATDLRSFRNYAGIAVSGSAWEEMSGTARLGIFAAAARGTPLYVCANKPADLENRKHVVFDAGGSLNGAASFFAYEAVKLVAKLDYLPPNVKNVTSIEHRQIASTVFELFPPIHPAGYKNAELNENLKKLKTGAQTFAGKYFYARSLFSRPELRAALDEGKRSLEEAWFAEPMKEAVEAQKIATRKQDILRIIAVIALSGLLGALYFGYAKGRPIFIIAYIVLLFSFALTSWNAPGAEFSLKHISQDDALRVVTEVQAVYRVNTGVKGAETPGAARFDAFEAGTAQSGIGGLYLRTERRAGEQVHRNPYPSVLTGIVGDNGDLRITLENKGRQPFSEVFIGYGDFAFTLGSVAAGQSVSIWIPRTPKSASFRDFSRGESIDSRLDMLMQILYTRRVGPLAPLKLSDAVFGQSLRMGGGKSLVLAPYAENGTLFDIFPEDAPWLLALIREPAGDFESVTIIEQTGMVKSA